MLLIVLVGLSAASAASVPPRQSDHLIDSILEDAAGRLSVNRQLPALDLSLSPLLDLSLTAAPATIRGPTSLKRFGNSNGDQNYEQGRLTAVVLLGQLELSLPSFQFSFFGYQFSSQLQHTLPDAYSQVQIDIIRDNLATCEVAVKVLPPRGARTLHIGNAHGPARIFTAILEMIFSFFLDYIPFISTASNLFEGLSFIDVTSHLERELTISAKRLAC